MGIRMAKHSYNTKLEKYRRHTSPGNLEQVQMACKEYTKPCPHVRNLYWNQWITDCNNNNNSSVVWRRIKAANGTAPRAPTHHRHQEEAESLCDSFAQRCSQENLHEDTINKLTLMAPARVHTTKTAAWNRFTLSKLEYVLYRWKDTAPRDDTVYYSMIKNAPLATGNLFLRLNNQSFTEERLTTKWKIATIIPIPKKDKTNRPISLLPAFSKVMERLVLT